MTHHLGASAHTQYMGGALVHGFPKSTQHLGQISPSPEYMAWHVECGLHVSLCLSLCLGNFVQGTPGWTSPTLYDCVAWEAIRVVAVSCADTVSQ